MNLPKVRIAAVLFCSCVLLPSPMALAADQYFLLNYSEGGSNSTNIMTYVQQKFGVANAASDLKVGVAVIYYPGGSETNIPKSLKNLTNDLAMAKRMNIPILLQVDVENVLPTSLLNWYDPAQPGYNTNKTSDVEWFGWSPTNAIKLCWRNWGVQIRVGPQPNLLSTNYQAWEKTVYTNYLPYVTQWYDSLAVTQKWLFVGWKCGWETKLNSQYYYFTNGNSYYGQPAGSDPEWNAPKQTLGYNAAQTGGFKTNGVLNFSGGSDYAMQQQLIGRHLTYLSSLAYSNGIPRGKIFLHSVVEGIDRYNTDKLLNFFANPGASCYPSSNDGALKNNASFMMAVHTDEAIYGGTGYGYGEFNFYNVNKTNYNVCFDWFTNNLRGDADCIYQALYNSDTMQGNTNMEKAMLDAMALSPATYSVTYNGNGNTGGPPPTNSAYAPGATVTVAGGGALTKAGHTLTGWNTAANGSGTSFGAGNTFSILADTTLYAQWSRVSLAAAIVGPKLVLNWPTGQNWQLQAQTNSLSSGIKTNWFIVTSATPPYTNNLNSANPLVLYRLNQTNLNYGIYQDTLASGWSMNGFNSAFDTANPAPVHSGITSISLTLTNGGYRGPYGPNISTTNYSYLSFWIHGGATGGQVLSLTSLRSGSIAATWYIPNVPANSWMNYMLPLSLINVSNVPDFNGLRFVNNLTGQDAPPFYVDDIELIP